MCCSIISPAVFDVSVTSHYNVTVLTADFNINIFLFYYKFADNLRSFGLFEPFFAILMAVSVLFPHFPNLLGN